MFRSQEDESPHLRDCLQKLFGCVFDLNKKNHMIVLIHLLGWSFHGFLSYFQTGHFLSWEGNQMFSSRWKLMLLFFLLISGGSKGNMLMYITIDTHTQAEHIYLSVHIPTNTLPAPDTPYRQCWRTEVQCWFLWCLPLEACWIPSPVPAPHANAPEAALDILAEASGGKRDNDICPVMPWRGGMEQRRAGSLGTAGECFGEWWTRGATAQAKNECFLSG